MLQVMPGTLRERLADEFGFIPNGFLDNLQEGKSFVYLASCNEARLIFMEPSPLKITGFTAEEMMAGGIDMQISRIHPDDLASLYDKAIQIIRNNVAAAKQGGRITPLILNYRIRRADDKWIEVRETKLFRYSDGSRDLVLGKLEDITEQAIDDRFEAQKFFAGSGDDYPILNALNKYRKMIEKSPLLPSAEPATHIPEGMEEITKREKEILYLIGAGLSTKQIASRLFISINTVQTHRANLLKKLQVKNSMELIREVSKAFWL